MNHYITIARVFILGAREFRSDLGMTYDDDTLTNAYDWGRETMHRITRRRYDQTI